MSVSATSLYWRMVTIRREHNDTYSREIAEIDKELREAELRGMRRMQEEAALHADAVDQERLAQRIRAIDPESLMEKE